MAVRVIFRQITHDDLGCASYLIGDEGAGIAAVVDPRFEIEEYLRLARYLGVSIRHVLETHTHADHVSGHGRLAAATGATIHVHREADPDYDHEPFDDGWELELGTLTVRAIHTPGHRPEHTAFVLVDTDRGDEPWALLSGDSLFVGDVARPDLAITDEQEFVDHALAGLGPQPPNFEAIVALNRGPLLTAGVELPPLAPRQVERRQLDGALLVDVRTDVQFDEAHVPGAVGIPTMRAGFGSKLAWIADREQPIVLIGRDGEEAREAGALALAVGIRNLAGFLDGGMSSWRQEERPVARIERVPIDELAGRMEAEPALQLLDVRDRPEWDRGHIAGAWGRAGRALETS